MVRKEYWKAALAGLCAVCLTGCTSAPAEHTAESFQQGAEDYVCATLFSDVAFWNPPAWDVTEGTVTGIITEKTGLAIDLMIPPQDGDTRLSLMLVNGELPDIICVTDPTAMKQLVTSGKVWQLEEFLAAYCPDSHILTAFPEDMKRELTERDGGWYAFPSHINSAGAMEIWEPASDFFVEYQKYNENSAIIWNRKLLEIAGLSVEELKTEEQVLAAFEKVKEMQLEVEGEPVIPMLLDGKDYQESTLLFLERTFGAEYVDDEGNYTDIRLQPETRHALQFLNQVMREGYAEPEQMLLDNDQVKEYIASGRVLCFIGNVANTAMEPADWISSGAILSPYGERPVLGKNNITGTGWISTYISKDCVNPEAVAGWLDYMTSEEGMLLWDFGLEGTDYVIDEDQLVVRTAEGRKKSRHYSSSGLVAWWMFVNYSWERHVMKEPEDEDEIREYRIYTEYGRDEETVIYDNSVLSVSNAAAGSDSGMGSLQAAVDSYAKGQIPLIILAGDEASFGQMYVQFQDGLKEAGIEILDEKKNEIYEENCERYGFRLEKINR